MKVIYMSGYRESALVQDGVLERNTVLLQSRSRRQEFWK
jgi:hypothetical protein